MSHRMEIYNPGVMFHRLEVHQQVVTGQDAHGQLIRTWQCLEVVAGRVEDLQGRDLELARQMYHLATKRVTLHGSSLINTATRLVWEGRILNIGYVQNPDGRNMILVLFCSEGAGNG